MNETLASNSNIATVPDSSEVQSKIGPVARFDGNNEERQPLSSQPTDALQHATINNNDFIGLTREVRYNAGYSPSIVYVLLFFFSLPCAQELKAYINSPKWKRIRLIIALLYLLVIALLLAGSIYFIISSPRCPPKPKLEWYQRDIIYEIDVATFRDTNNDGIGDIRGLIEKLPYLKSISVKSILLDASIFNASISSSTRLDGQIVADKRVDLMNIDPRIGKNEDLQDLKKILTRQG
jgi:hypothetical protein